MFHGPVGYGWPSCHCHFSAQGPNFQLSASACICLRDVFSCQGLVCLPDKPMVPQNKCIDFSIGSSQPTADGSWCRNTPALPPLSRANPEACSVRGSKSPPLELSSITYSNTSRPTAHPASTSFLSPP